MAVFTMRVAFLFLTISLFSPSRASPQGWTSDGCYIDPPERLLWVKYDLFDKSTMTWEMCVGLCENDHFKFAGLEDGYTCYCDEALRSTAVRTSRSKCGTKCPGNVTQDCGGVNRLKLFERTAAYPSSTSSSPFPTTSSIKVQTTSLSPSESTSSTSKSPSSSSRATAMTTSTSRTSSSMSTSRPSTVTSSSRSSTSSISSKISSSTVRTTQTFSSASKSTSSSSKRSSTSSPSSTFKSSSSSSSLKPTSSVNPPMSTRRSTTVLTTETTSTSISSVKPTSFSGSTFSTSGTLSLPTTTLSSTKTLSTSTTAKPSTGLLSFETSSSSSKAAGVTATTVLRSTATDCPYYQFLDPMISQNSTSSNFTYALYGTLDGHGLPATGKKIGFWRNTVLQNLPDMLLDISNPSIMRAIYYNGTNVIIDTVNNKIVVSDCNNQATLPFSQVATKRRRSRTDSEVKRISYNPSVKSKRDTYIPQGALQVTLTYKTKCGDADQWEYPQVYCEDRTPGYAIRPYPKHATVAQTSPGIYSATCSFLDTADFRNNSPGCLLLLPLLVGVCSANDVIQPAGIPGGAICIALLLDPFTAPLVPVCLDALELLSTYCAVQTALDGDQGGQGGLKDGLCGKTPDSSDMRILIGGPYPKADYDLGTQNSKSSSDINFPVPNPVPADGSCTPCNQNSRLFTTPWQTIYSGSLGLRQSFPCDDKVYYGAINAGSLGDADSQCRSIAETNHSGVYFADQEDFFDDNHNLVYTGYGCWVWSCPTTAADFTFDVDAYNGGKGKVSAQTIAYSRDVSYEQC